MEAAGPRGLVTVATAATAILDHNEQIEIIMYIDMLLLLVYFVL